MFVWLLLLLLLWKTLFVPQKKIEEIRSLLPAYVHIIALAAVEILSVFRLLFVACAEETTAG